MLKRELGAIILRELPAEEVGMATVNEVLVSSDLRNAEVYVGFLGDESAQRAAWNLLLKHRSRIQDALGEAIHLKRTPRLRFIHDHAIERGDRILQIIEDSDQALPPAEECA